MLTAELPADAPETPDEPTTGNAVTIAMNDAANRTSLTTEKQVWEQNGITVTNDKAASKTNVADYVPARFYQNSNLTVAYPGMTKIEFKCNDYKSTYAPALVATLEAAGYIATADGLVVTLEFESAVDSIVIENLTAQVRFDTITVYVAEAG